ncbi:LysR family transcriptional regulator [Shimia marina]|uniref:Gcv operon activator n=1 Tax=Shimia marina TaxID=321267 RepID=A0A0P1ETX4_9RHOB|nr:LysR family transcriptional regulator [Shimia marina]CUH54091.1 Gcv operon activator [Shimia marina]SFE60237.1 transcriptional regulator, LysR family [Shimia marina]
MDKSGFDQMPLEWVRAFEAAARLGSFTAAAQESGLTQSAISQRIGHLEARLGTQLFIRQARQITLTAEGEAWLPHVQAALMGLRDSTEALFGVSRNRLTLSASASVNELWVVPRMAALAQVSGAQISLSTMVVSSGEALDEAALRIRYGSGDWPVHYARPLYEERMSPVAAPSLVGQEPVGKGLAKQVRWQDLPRLSVSGPRPGWRRWCEQTGTATTPVPQLRFDTFATGLAAARAGHGVLLASLPLVASDLAAGRLVRLSDEVLHHHETYWLLGARERLSRRQWQEVSGCLAQI